jgi:hypothetical protein
MNGERTHFKADKNQVEPSRLHLAIGRTGLSIQEVMPLAVDDGICHNVAIKTITIHVIEVVISITTIITYLYNYI